jgi:pyruvate-ferredoxin/flavodoxin oxidoreductase
MKEARFSMLARSDPARSAMLMGLAQAEIDERWHYYEQLAGLERHLADREDVPGVHDVPGTSSSATDEGGDDA